MLGNLANSEKPQNLMRNLPAAFGILVMSG
jgi:hypothetical protein